MTKIKIFLFSCFAFMMATNLQAQCPGCAIAGNAYGTGAAPAASTVLVDFSNGCNWTGEDASITGIVNGDTYAVTQASGTVATFITIYNAAGTCVTAGTVSVGGVAISFAANDAGTYTVVTSTDAASCGAVVQTCRVLNVECTSCPPPAAVCGDATCETAQGEDYCSCDADCPCTGATPSFVTGAENGGTLAGSAVPVVYCESEINTGGVNPAPELVYIPFAAFGQQTCVTDWTVSTNFGTLFNSTDPISAYTAPTPDNIITYVGLTDADITASAGTVTITFVDATTAGGCTYTLAIDLSTAVDAAAVAWSGTAAGQCSGVCASADATFVSYDCATSTVVIDVIDLGSPTAGSSYMVDVQDGLGTVVVAGVPLVLGNMSFVLPDNSEVYDLVISDGITAGCNIGFFNSVNLYGDCLMLGVGCTDVILEGDLETLPAVAWTESSTDGAGIQTPFGVVGTTGVIAGVNGAWLGGYGAGFDFDTDATTPNAGPYTTSITQSVTIPVGTAMMYFWGQWGVCDSPSDVFTMSIDGTAFITLNGGDVNCGGNWREYSADVSALADGAAHTVVFMLVEQGLDPAADGASNSNFFVDEVTLESCPTTTCPDDFAAGGLGNSQPALTGAVSASGTTDYETPGVISSTQTVDVNTDYDSGDCIDMQADFEVVLGVEFDAFIDGANCNGMGGNQFNGGSSTAAKGTTSNRIASPSIFITNNDKTSRSISRASELKTNRKVLAKELLKIKNN